MPVDKTQYTQMPLMSDFAAKIRSAATSGLTSPEPTINAKTIKPKSSSSGRGGFNNMDPWKWINYGVAATSALVDPDEDSTYNYEQGLSKTLMQSGNPVLATAGLFTDISSKGAQLFGTNNNSISDTQRNTVGLNRFQQIANNVLGGASNMLSFGLLGGNRVNDAYKSGIVDEYSDSFAGSSRRINNIGSMGGKKYVIGGKKINDAVQTSNRENEIITSLGLTNNPIKSSLAYNMDSARDSYLDNLYGKQMYIKNGALLPSKEELKKIYASRKVLDNPTIVLKEGGVIGVDTNVIPEGSLHATKNHLEEVNPELDKVTEKGIPVVVTDENGDYTQVAEIEKEELVFTKSLTDKIEELWKINTEESMIEAGKILAEELMENTQDNTNTTLDGNN